MASLVFALKAHSQLTEELVKLVVRLASTGATSDKSVMIAKKIVTSALPIVSVLFAIVATSSTKKEIAF